MKLYYAPGACSLSPHIVAREAKLPLQLVRVDTKAHLVEDGRDFYEVNPRGYVPVLELDDGTRMREGTAIVQFLADAAPQARLVAPSGTRERVRAQEWLNFIATEYHKQFIWILRGATGELLSQQVSRIHRILTELTRRPGCTHRRRTRSSVTTPNEHSRMPLTVALRPVALALLGLTLGLPLQQARSADQGATPLAVQLGLEEGVTPVNQRPGWRPLRKIIVRNLQFPGVESLQSVAPNVQFVVTDTIEAAVAQASDADAVIGWCDARLLQAGPQIRWIQFLYAGVESCVSVPKVREREVLLTNMQRVQAPIIAEHAIAMMFALARGLDLGVAQQPSGAWRPDAVLSSGRLRTLKDKTLLVVGLGGIGTEVAQRAHALGLRVIATRATGRTGPDFVSYVGAPEELPKLTATADVIVNALPLTLTTRATFDARVFDRTKRGALFVNVGRGGTVVTSALIDALRSGTLGGAALDVTDPEPLPPDHPLWQAPNLIITPHISSESELGVSRVWEIVRENLRRYIAGDKLLSEVDVSRGY